MPSGWFNHFDFPGQHLEEFPGQIVAAGRDGVDVVFAVAGTARAAVRKLLPQDLKGIHTLFIVTSNFVNFNMQTVT